MGTLQMSYVGVLPRPYLTISVSCPTFAYESRPKYQHSLKETQCELSKYSEGKIDRNFKTDLN